MDSLKKVLAPEKSTVQEIIFQLFVLIIWITFSLRYKVILKIICKQFKYQMLGYKGLKIYFIKHGYKNRFNPLLQLIIYLYIDYMHLYRLKISHLLWQH